MAQIINLQAFKNFVKQSYFGGLLLFTCVILSLLVANTTWGAPLNDFLNRELGFENDFISAKYTILSWINDGLMAIFFLMVGLEIKRELVEGELSSPKKAALPILCAIGGAIVPALIYLFFNRGLDTAHGWGIPMATDIAFALTVITLLGKSVPPSLKIFLAALAIVDDLIAILVIALFYSSDLHLSYLAYAAILLILLVIFNKMGVKKLYFYWIPGIAIWYFVHHSGIHATIAGVLVAFTLPTNDTAKESPLERLEHLIAKPVNFLIIPLFAFVNTNITIDTSLFSSYFSPLGSGISFGLILGKFIGILGVAFIASKLKIALLPEQASWTHMAGLGLLGGIGFTMSIFVSILSFDDPHHVDEAKFAILLSSIVAGILGYLILRIKPKTIHYQD